jgi:hypothetical protein
MAMMSGIVLDSGGEEPRHRGGRDAPPQGRIGRTRPHVLAQIKKRHKRY